MMLALEFLLNRPPPSQNYFDRPPFYPTGGGGGGGDRPPFRPQEITTRRPPPVELYRPPYRPPPDFPAEEDNRPSAASGLNFRGTKIQSYNNLKSTHKHLERMSKFYICT